MDVIFLLSFLQDFTREEDEPIGNCSHSSAIKELAWGEESRTQLLALSQILQC